MTSKHLSKIILGALFVQQFLVVPTFSLMDQGGKVVFFSISVLLITAWMIIQNREWHIPKVFIPLFCLFIVFSISLLFSQWPVVGLVELYVYLIGLVFLIVVFNISKESEILFKNVFKWFHVIGLTISLLCVYQYVYWIIYKNTDNMIIPYLLPPGNARVSGIYGQPNITSILLLVSIISFLSIYVDAKLTQTTTKTILINAGLFIVSTAFFLTRSNGGLLAFSVFIGVFFFLLTRGKITLDKRALTRFFLILLVGFLVSRIPISTGTYIKGPISVDARFVFWAASYLMFRDAPLLGVGLDHFKLFLPSYARPAHDLLGFVQYEAMGYTVWSHNEIFQILAESGIIGLTILVIFVLLLFRIILIEHKKEKPASENIILFLMLIPFFVQGMFSWNFRHPALFFIFLFILGISIRNSEYFKIKIKGFLKILIYTLISMSIFVIFFITYEEYQYVALRKNIKENGCKDSKIFSLLSKPNLEFRILQEILPLCLDDRSNLEDKDFAKKLKPLFLKITKLQGTHSQWYNLGLLHRSLGEYDLASSALRKSVERQPVFEEGWFALHMLNIEKAVRETGRPIEEFLPPEPASTIKYLDMLPR